MRAGLWAVSDVFGTSGVKIYCGPGEDRELHPARVEQIDGKIT
jgi:hypothetical protein